MVLKLRERRAGTAQERAALKTPQLREELLPEFSPSVEICNKIGLENCLLVTLHHISVFFLRVNFAKGTRSIKAAWEGGVGVRNSALVDKSSSCLKRRVISSSFAT